MKTIFLDRDGVINRKRPDDEYVTSWEEFEFLPGAKEALRLLSDAGLRLIVVTNQRGIARGRLTEADLEGIHRRMGEELRQAGVVLDAIYHCPHEKDSCECRKPRTGLFLQAQKDFPSIAFAESAVAGDALSDMEAGARLGCQTYLVAEDARREVLLHQAHEQLIRIDGAAPSLLEVVVRHLRPTLPPVSAKPIP
jgi:D-glycero-D-manno-heptose 1,7-bisphosphate phosphatase